MPIFKLKSQLPHDTQLEINRISAIPTAQRTTHEAAFLTAIGVDYISNAVIAYDNDGNILYASGVTVPTGCSGFAKGATFLKTDASTNGMYMNTGSTTVSAWDLVDQASTANIDDGAVTMAKLADIATARIIGRATAATGVPEALTAANVRTMINVADGANNYVHPNHTGEVTSTGDGATVVATPADFTAKDWRLAVKSGTPVNAVSSRGTLTVTGGGSNIADGDKVTVDTKQYTFKTLLTPTEGEVLIGLTDTAALLNLLNALNHTGTPGTDYSCAAAHPTVLGQASTATTLVAEARTKGVIGNSIASTKEIGAALSWDALVLGTTRAGVNGTVGALREVVTDTSYLYMAIAANTIADANWRRIDLGSAY